MSTEGRGLSAENFDGFVLLRSGVVNPDASDVAEFVKSIRDQITKGGNLIFLELAKATSFPAEVFAREMALINEQFGIEVVLVLSSKLAENLQATRLASLVTLYEQREDGVRKLATKKIIQRNFNAIQGSLQKSMDGAIDAGVKRWTGHPPRQVGAAAANVNPTTDVVSVVTMHIDGGEFRLYLSSSQTNMRGLASQLLKTEIAESDPAISDSACELLNYLTAYFRQQLTDEDSTVDATPPQILQPDEMMALLDHTPQVRRVHTQHGHFDFWIEVAA